MPLYVLSQATNKGRRAKLSCWARSNPRIIVPQQEPVFDSADPFFVADHSRTYLVQPNYFTISSSPQELDNLTYAGQWATEYQFETFYHPYARTFLRELEIGGVRSSCRATCKSLRRPSGAGRRVSISSLYTPNGRGAALSGRDAAPDPSALPIQARRLDFDPAPPAPIRSTTGRSSTTRRCSLPRC